MSFQGLEPDGCVSTPAPSALIAVTPEPSVALEPRPAAPAALPTRHDLFVMLRWQNAFAPQWDVSGFARRNQADHSRLVWLEARYRGERTDWALQWQANLGGPSSEYGALPQRRLVQFVMKHYF